MLLDPSVIEDPYPFYRQLHAEAPVWLVPGTEVCVVSSFELVAEATNRVADFSSSMHHFLYRGDDGLPARLPFGEGTQILAVADPPIHTVHRGVVFPDLMNKRMASLEPEVEAVAARCIDAAMADGTVDFMAAIGNVVPITMISKLIGFRDSDLGSLLRAAVDSTALVGARMTRDQLDALMVRSAETNLWITQQLHDYGGASIDELLTTVADGVRDGAMSEGDGVILLQTLLSAGGESTTSLLGNSIRILAERPELQRQIRDDPECIPTFVEEVLRLESPFRFLARHTPAATSLGGVEIPAGTTVLLFWGAANRAAAEFDDADELLLDRRIPRHHVAFGRGIHFCVGAPLARLEARVVLTALLERTIEISLDPHQQPIWFDSLQVRRHQYLPVTLTADV
jgi:cytochrome P450